MRLRFSLRTLWIATTLIAVSSYFWLVRPSQLAEDFAAAVAAEDYPAADRFFAASEPCLAKWAAQYTAFRTQAKLYPLTLGQLLAGRRYVDFQISYFEFDSTAIRKARLAATSFGIRAPKLSSKEYSGIFVDRVPNSVKRYPVDRNEQVEVEPEKPPR